MSPLAGTAMLPTKAPGAAQQSTAGDVLDQVPPTHDAIARRAFEIFEHHGRGLSNGLDDWFRAESELLHLIKLEITGRDDNLKVRTESRGFNTRELEINVRPRRLRISGEHEEPLGDRGRHEAGSLMQLILATENDRTAARSVSVESVFENGAAIIFAALLAAELAVVIAGTGIILFSVVALFW